MSWRLVCPYCEAIVPANGETRTSCGTCSNTLDRGDGIWRLISEQRLEHFRAFLDTYNKVRLAEGRGTLSPAMLRALPACPATHSLAPQWRIRRASCRSLMRLLQTHLPKGARILDLGAGTGWLSYQFSRAGFSPCAVDLRDDPSDGLGAARHFKPGWPIVQGDVEKIPLADHSADAVIYNASFHYLQDQAAGIREALRVLRPGGLLVILDSPIYSDAGSGERMLQEQQDYFVRLIGQRSDSLATSGFLTWGGLSGFADQFNLAWRFKRPWYGIRWALRPLLSKIRGQREPAAFAIAWAYAPSNIGSESVS